MNFFNNTTTSKKSSNGSSSVIDVSSNQPSPETDWKRNNLSWAESTGNNNGGTKIVVEEEDIIFDSNSVPQVKDLMQTNHERTIASIFGNSLQDTPVVALVKSLESYPKPDQIARQREVHEQNIAKLQKAKLVLSAVTTISQGVNPDAVKAYTATEAALNEAVLSRDKYESELRSQSQSIKQLIANCQSEQETARIAQGILDLYAFSEVN
jgi:hypothetical protein